MLRELLKEVREENLPKDRLEYLHLALSNALADMKQEIASLKKERAIFMAHKEQDESVANRKVSFDATPSGQRLIELEGDAPATRIWLDSLKSRLYSIY